MSPRLLPTSDFIFRASPYLERRAGLLVPISRNSGVRTPHCTLRAVPSHRTSSLVASSHLEGPSDECVRETRYWSRWLTHQTESGSGGYLAGSRRVARATTTWAHASARRWGETWVRSIKIPRFLAVLGETGILS